jgi:hypothetical protein
MWKILTWASYFSPLPLFSFAGLGFLGNYRASFVPVKDTSSCSIFINSIGHGEEHRITFGSAERQRWQNVVVKVKLFYFSIFFEFLSSLVNIADMQQRSLTTPVKSLASGAGPSVLGLPVVDQTPGVKFLS